MPPNGDAKIIAETTANFLEFYDAAIGPHRAGPAADLHAAATMPSPMVTPPCRATPATLAPNGQPQWIDVRVAVGASITIDFYVDGVLQSSATAANTGGKGKPVQVVFANVGLHGSVSSRTWYYAHIAILDGGLDHRAALRASHPERHRHLQPDGGRHRCAAGTRTSPRA